MPSETDDLLFAAETSEPAAPGRQTAWKVLIVDDDEQIHAVTRMVLHDFSFRDLPLEFLSAYSAAEGYALMRANPDVAVCFLDVVMETDHAGLDLAHDIRGKLANPFVRIILRTGQPGQAPERRVIVDYDINDYKEKSELTAQKLFSTMVTALRSYKDIMTIETSRRGLEKIIIASAELFRIRAMEPFLSGLLLQLGSLLEVGVDAVMVSARAFGDAEPDVKEMAVVAASGRFTAMAGAPASDLEASIQADVGEVIDTRMSKFRDKHSVIYFHANPDRVTVLYMETGRPLGALDHRLIELFCSNASIGLDLVA
jgi:CheY-like chemotaxis protein